MKTMVLFHGWGAPGRIWQRQVAAWGGLLEVLAPTIPRWERGWLSSYLQGLPLEECVLVGWSLGGMLLLETLAGLAATPGGLVLVGVAAVFCQRPDYPWGQQAKVVRAMRQGLNDDPQGVLTRFADRCLAPGEKAFRAEVLAYFQTGTCPENLAPGLDYLLRQDLRPHLSRVAGRPVIVQGDQDAIVSRAQAQFLHDQIPGSRLYLLPGAGHLPFLTQAAAFNEILEDILRGGLGEFFVSVPPPSP
ncbi:MAG: alpha/beta fold hydrolase [Desulfobaccales bacterium]|nr:alpha/beta fold hydrolase [Desulfobaccales bacterium]